MSVTNQTTNHTQVTPNMSYNFFKVINSLELTFLIPYIVITLFAVVGNIIIICTISIHSTMKTLHYRLILNMAISDLIFTVISPIHVYWELNDGRWFLGDIGCKVFYFVFRCLYAFSVLTLIVITTERYIAVRFPIRFRHNQPRAVVTVSCIWIVSMAFTAPLIPVHHEIRIGQTKHCFQQGWSSQHAYYTYHGITYIVLYVIPLVVMTVLYAMTLKLLWRPQRPNMTSEGMRTLKIRRKKARMVMLLVLSFFACWTPWSILESIVVFGAAPISSKAFFLLMHYSMLMVFASAAVNPILYGVLSEEIRQAMKHLIWRCCPQLPVQVHPQAQNNSLYISNLESARKLENHNTRVLHEAADEENKNT